MLLQVGCGHGSCDDKLWVRLCLAPAAPVIAKRLLSVSACSQSAAGSVGAPKRPAYPRACYGTKLSQQSLAARCVLKQLNTDPNPFCRLRWCSFLGIWSQASHSLELPYWIMLICGLSASTGVVFLDAGCMVTSCQNFAAEQGKVAGADGHEKLLQLLPSDSFLHCLLNSCLLDLQGFSSPILG